MTKPLLAILLLLPLSVSAGEVDGVNVSCEAKSRGETLLWTDYLFLSFSDGKVTHRDLGATSNAAEVEEEVYNYVTTDRSVFWEIEPSSKWGGDVQTYFLNRAKLTIDIRSEPKDGCYTGGLGAAWERAANGIASTNRCKTREEAYSCRLLDAESAEEELDSLRQKYRVIVDDSVRAQQEAREEQRKWREKKREKNKI